MARSRLTERRGVMGLHSLVRALLSSKPGMVFTLVTALIGTTAIVPTSNIPSDQPGFDLVTFTLPATVDRGDNLPVVVRVGVATSRPTPGDSPPLVKINP